MYDTVHMADLEPVLCHSLPQQTALSLTRTSLQMKKTGRRVSSEFII